MLESGAGTTSRSCTYAQSASRPDTLWPIVRRAKSWSQNGSSVKVPAKAVRTVAAGKGPTVEAAGAEAAEGHNTERAMQPATHLQRQMQPSRV